MIHRNRIAGIFMVVILLSCGSSSIAVQPSVGSTGYFNQALALDNQKKYTEALDWYRKAAESAPQNAYYQGRLGQQYFVRLHDWERAIPCYKMALALKVRGTWVPTQLAKALCWQAEMHVAGARWKAAANSYAEAAAIARKHGILMNSLGYYDEMAKLAKKADAGFGLVTPRFEHKVMLILVREVSLAGPVAVAEKMTDGEAAMARKSLAYVQNWVYAATAGNIRIRADVIEWKKSISALTVASPSSFQFDPEKASIAMNQIFSTKTDSTDAFIFVWGSQKYQTAHGGAGYFRIDENKYRIWRGLVKIPSMRMLHNGPSLMAHEFFHVIENMFSISPRHGFANENRGSFPAWKGKSEFEFYHWVLGRLIPDMLKLEKWRVEGWRNFNFRLKYLPRGL